MIVEQDLVYVGHEVPTLPDGWSMTTLEQLVSEQGLFCDGDWVESKDQDPNGDVRLIQLADIGVGSYRDRSDRYLTSERASALSCSFLERGDILVARMPDPLGRACIFPDDKRRAVTVVDVAIVRPNNPDVSNRWLMHRINSMAFRNAVASLQSGSTRLRISRKNLARIAFPLPPLVEQIAAVEEIEKQFSRLDEAVANLQRVKANLKRYKASVLKAAVEGRLVETEASIAQREGRSYETGEKLLQRILEERRANWSGKRKYKEPVKPEIESLSALPDGWAWTSPEQLSAGEPYSLAIGPFGSSLKVSDYKTEGVPLVFVRNIRSGVFGGDNTVYVSTNKAAELSAHAVEAGDILVTKMGDPPGDVCRYPANRPPAVITADCIKLRLTKFGVDPSFIEYVIASRVVQDQILSITKGVAQLKVNLANFSSIALPLPPFPEQIRIVAEVDRRLSIINEVEAEVDSNLLRAGALRQTLLTEKITQPQGEKNELDRT